MPVLQWLDRDRHVNAAEAVPYRLLEPDETQSAGDADTPNMLIQGDNLEALKALLPYYAGRLGAFSSIRRTTHAVHSSITTTIWSTASGSP